jgi:hypothetical protein
VSRVSTNGLDNKVKNDRIILSPPLPKTASALGELRMLGSELFNEFHSTLLRIFFWHLQQAIWRANLKPPSGRVHYGVGNLEPTAGMRLIPKLITSAHDASPSS